MFCLYTNYHPTKYHDMQLPESVKAACESIKEGPAGWYIDSVSSHWGWDSEEYQWPEELLVSFLQLHLHTLLNFEGLESG
ncbi:hypothetical protein SERLADRAFT_403075 [Serpula lacrymans var. lacrymans S7.9]|uniref:Uncharacterized protein n=1 Tax=Serpula lacrymans var. lacrymans (strain S7.9) TaxID=578457 RepID=F8PCK4_SERL9|nr:uncharacterized protein SERLADRAFT_403075 [Serpula lacrymans var. lacrymans S7.9]EGO18956.1 hypothetical protein SERLADRAFT_403075 [Serpula lacrymans var. lacrymans S7.9]